MQQLPSSGAVITDEVQLPRAETTTAAKSTRTPPLHHTLAHCGMCVVCALSGVCGLEFEGVGVSGEFMRVINIWRLEKYYTFIRMWVGSWTQYSGQSSAHSKETKGTGLGWVILHKTKFDRTDLGHCMVVWV